MTVAAVVPEIWLVPTKIYIVHVTSTTPLSAMICHPWARTCSGQPAYQIWRLYLYPLRRYEKRCKIWKMWWFAV